MSTIRKRMTLSKQRGVASLLVMIMVGLSLSAAMVGSQNQLRTAQEQSISVHAQTQAQARAWAAAEAFRQYLEQWRTTEADWSQFQLALSEQFDVTTGMTVSLGLDGVSARIVKVEMLESHNDEGVVPHITVQFIASVVSGSRAEAASMLEVTYAGATPIDGAQGLNPGVINFQGGLTLTGGIDVFGEEDAEGNRIPYEINVIGDVSIKNTKIVGVDIIRATGSIDFSGSVSWFKEMYANCDIQLVSSGAAEQIHATRNICMRNTSNEYKGSYKNPSLLANGSVDVVGGNYAKIFAKAGKDQEALFCEESAARVCEPPLDGISLGPTPTVDLLKTQGNVLLTSSGTVTEGQVEGDLQFTWGLKNSTLLYGGALNAPQGFNAAGEGVNLRKQDGLSVDIVPAQRVALTREVFDVKELLPYANYHLYIDADGRQRVAVNHLKGQPQAVHYLVSTMINNQAYNDFICKVPQPITPNDCIGKFGFGHSDQNTAISYDAATKTWVLNGKGLAQGVVYVEGNLDIQNGSYYNTFLVTGDVKSAGETKVYAPNYAGFAGGTYGSGEHSRNIPRGMCSRSFSELLPTQFCVGSEFNYDYARGLGNYAVMSGQCLDIGCTQYAGGDIKTYAYSQFFGAMKAGNQFVTGGDSRVDGYITALGLRNSGPHVWNNKTSIDLVNLPPGYDPSGAKPYPGAGSPPTNASTDIRWSRYF